MNSVNAHVGNHLVLNPRIIKGIYRMKQIPVIQPSRPPLARIRRIIFDTLEHRHKMVKVLDLCCGSGSLGLEALSRGASEVVFIDKDASVIQNLNQTIKRWHIPTDIVNPKARTYVCDATRVKITECFDTIFVDLPFLHKKENIILSNILSNNLANTDSIIVVKSIKNHHYNHDGFEVIKQKDEGRSSVIFFKRKIELDIENKQFEKQSI
ncbi:RsmD family RNA methyltransferase [Candidatus Cytomitobacter primus]|nr:RsmD family RNA methyltransferase [Candidatus Cytomitobacter primus]